MLPNQASVPLRRLFRPCVRLYHQHSCGGGGTSADAHKPSLTPVCSSSSSPSTLLSSIAGGDLLSTTKHASPHPQDAKSFSTSSSCAFCDVVREHAEEEADKKPLRLDQKTADKSKAILAASFEDLMRLAPKVETGFEACLVVQRLSALHCDGQTQSLDGESLLQYPQLSRVSQMIDRDVVRLSPKVVLSTLRALYDMSDADVYVTKSLVVQVLWLLRRLPMPQLVQFLQLHLGHQETGLRESVVLQSLAALERRWVELTSLKDIVFLMYTLQSGGLVSQISDSRMTQGLTERLEDRALDMVEHASAKELYRILYLLSRQRHRNTPLIRAAAYHLNKTSLTALSTVQLSNLLYALCTLSVHDPSVMAKVAAQLGARHQDLTLTPKLAVGFLTSFSRLRWKEGAAIQVLLDVIEGRAPPPPPGGRESSEIGLQRSVEGESQGKIPLNEQSSEQSDEVESRLSERNSSQQSVSVMEGSSQQAPVSQTTLTGVSSQDSSSSSSSASSSQAASSSSLDAPPPPPPQQTSCLESLDVSERAGLVLSLASLNVDSAESRDLVRRAVRSLLEGHRDLWRTSPLLWLDVVWALSVLGLLDQPSAASVLTQDFWGNLPGSDSFQSVVNLLKVNNINSAAVFELEGYTGPFLPAAISTADAKLLLKGERKVTEKLVSALSNFAPLESYTLTNTTAPGGYLIDAEFFVDSSGNPKPQSQASEASSDSHRVALKVLDFSDLTLPTSDLTGLHAMAVRHLRHQGYTVVEVQHTEVGGRTKVVELVQFLQTKVKDALNVKAGQASGPGS